MSDEGDMAIAGEDIDAGESAILAFSDRKVYGAGSTSGIYIGITKERIREGFRVSVRNEQIREDDA